MIPDEWGMANGFVAMVRHGNKVTIEITSQHNSNNKIRLVFGKHGEIESGDKTDDAGYRMNTFDVLVEFIGNS